MCLCHYDLNCQQFTSQWFSILMMPTSWMLDSYNIIEYRHPQNFYYTFTSGQWREKASRSHPTILGMKCTLQQVHIVEKKTFATINISYNFDVIPGIWREGINSFLHKKRYYIKYAIVYRYVWSAMVLENMFRVRKRFEGTTLV